MMQYSSILGVCHLLVVSYTLREKREQPAIKKQGLFSQILEWFYGTPMRHGGVGTVVALAVTLFSS